MVLTVVRWEAGLVETKPSGGQTHSRGELENSSRQPRDLTKLGQKGSPLEKYLSATKKELLTLSRGLVKKGVADDDDDDDE
jgi:hypothetical protein